MQISKKTRQEILLENQQKKNDVLRQENEQLRADLDYISAMVDVPLEDNV